MASYEGSIELIGQVKTPYVAPDIPQKYIKSFRALKKDLSKLPTDDDQATGSTVRFLDTSEMAEYHAQTKKWYINTAVGGSGSGSGSGSSSGDPNNDETGVLDNNRFNEIFNDLFNF